MNIIKSFFIFSAPFVFTFGLLGNILTLCVYLRKKMRKKNSVWSYFLVKTFIDSLIIIHSIREFLKEKFNFDFVTLSSFTCKVSEFSLYLATPISAWTLVIICLDRFYKIKFPQKTLFLSQSKVQIITVIILIAFNIGFNSPLLILSELVNNGTNSSRECVQDESLQFFWWMDIFNSTLIPFIAMTIPTVATIYILFNSKRKFSKITTRDYKFAITSISLNFLFFLLNLPITLVFLIESYVEIDENTSYLIYLITDLIYHIYYGSMFYLNCIVNSVFLVEFLTMTRMRKISEKFLTNINNSYEATTSKRAN